MIQAEPIEIMRKPLTRSRSPRDFWGCRWNLIVHGLLKCGHGRTPADGLALVFVVLLSGMQTLCVALHQRRLTSHGAAFRRRAGGRYSYL